MCVFDLHHWRRKGSDRDVTVERLRMKHLWVGSGAIIINCLRGLGGRISVGDPSGSYE